MFVIIPWKLESLNSCDWYLSVRLLQRIFMRDPDVELIVTLPAKLRTFFWLGFELRESILKLSDAVVCMLLTSC